MNPVKASAQPNPAELIATFQQLGNVEGFRGEIMGEAAAYPLIAMTKRTPGVRPRIYLSAASHGDEPAGPAALVALLQNKFFDRRANWFICPVLNPGGLARGTRENPEGIDLNRDYRGEPKSTEVRAHVHWLLSQPRFDVHICLHEDWESTGFYLYEINSFNRPSLSKAVLAAVTPLCPIEMAELIDGRPNQQGIMQPIENLLERELWPESIYLRSEHTFFGYTLETPSGLPLERRVAAHCAAVSMIVNGVVANFEK